ncbi:hypothetical protein D3C85_1904970 [compost metagenome]
MEIADVGQRLGQDLCLDRGRYRSQVVRGYGQVQVGELGHGESGKKVSDFKSKAGFQHAL